MNLKLIFSTIFITNSLILCSVINPKLIIIPTTQNTHSNNNYNFADFLKLIEVEPRNNKNQSKNVTKKVQTKKNDS